MKKNLEDAKLLLFFEQHCLVELACHSNTYNFYFFTLSSISAKIILPLLPSSIFLCVPRIENYMLLKVTLFSVLETWAHTIGFQK